MSKTDLEVDDKEFLKPLDILSLGGDNDPCFGKEYDLTEDECRRCGDSELCSIAFSQKLNLQRETLEKQKDFKDLGKTPLSKEETYTLKLIKKELKASEIRKKLMKKFNLSKDEARQLIKSLK